MWVSVVSSNEANLLSHYWPLPLTNPETLESLLWLRLLWRGRGAQLSKPPVNVTILFFKGPHCDPGSYPSLTVALPATGRRSFSTGSGLQLKREKKRLKVFQIRAGLVCVCTGHLIWFHLNNLTNGFCGEQGAEMSAACRQKHWGVSLKQWTQLQTNLFSYESLPR